VSTEEDRIWDAEQDYAALGPRPVGGYLDDDEIDLTEDTEDEEPVTAGTPYIRFPAVNYATLDEHSDLL
jgi:hypothetical protein